MFTYKDIDNLLLYTFRINRYDFENNFDLIMVKHKDMYDIMRHNFSRFWYYCSYKEKFKWLELSNSNLEYYDNFNKFIKYLYEITVEEFDKKFYNGLYFKYDTNMLSYDKEKYIDKLKLFKNDISLFWLYLDNIEKERLMNLVIDYNLVLLEDKENELFNLSHIKEKYNDWCKDIDNLDEISYYLDDYSDLEIDDNNEDSDNYNSDDDQSYSSDISIVNNLNSNIKIFYCQQQNIKQLDNLPCKLSMLFCEFNKINSLDLLPSELVYLNCRNNKIKNIENLPRNLLYLDASNNIINNINSISSNLLYLNLSRNKRIIELKDLPDSLLVLDISLLNTVQIDKFPKNLKSLDIRGTKLSNYNILPDTLEELYCNEEHLENIKYLPNNISYIDCDGSYKETLIVPYGFSNSNNYDVKYIHYY